MLNRKFYNRLAIRPGLGRLWQQVVGKRSTEVIVMATNWLLEMCAVELGKLMDRDTYSWDSAQAQIGIEVCALAVTSWCCSVPDPTVIAGKLTEKLRQFKVAQVPLHPSDFLKWYNGDGRQPLAVDPQEKAAFLLLTHAVSTLHASSPQGAAAYSLKNHLPLLLQHAIVLQRWSPTQASVCCERTTILVCVCVCVCVFVVSIRGD
jgi:hypothetical protein